MTRWGTWLEGAAAPAAGARFEAVNKGSPGPAWKNRPVVTAAYPRTAATGQGLRCHLPHVSYPQKPRIGR